MHYDAIAHVPLSLRGEVEHRVPRALDAANARHLADLYRSGMSAAEVARTAGRSPTTVAKALRQHGLDTKRHRRPWTLPDELVARYQAGESIQDLSREYRVSAGVVSRELRRHGVAVRAKTMRWRAPSTLRAEYEAGASVLGLSKAHGVGRSAVERALRDAGATLRGAGEAARAAWEMSDDSRRREAGARAKRTLTGRSKTDMELVAVARAREARGRHDSEAERMFASWLSDLQPVPQFAIGPLNVDLAVDGVAVDIHSQWHNSARHRAVDPLRARYVTDHGWPYVVVWVNQHHLPVPRGGDQLRAAIESLSGDPAARRQYRVLCGCGHDHTAAYPNLDELSRVPSLVDCQHLRRGDKGVAGEA